MMRIGINAHLLNLSQSYRNAGVGRYIYYLLRQYALQADTHDRIILYTGASASALTEMFAANSGVPDHWQVRAPLWPTERPPLRIAWEQTALPMRAAIDRLDLVHAPVNVVPLASPVPSIVTIHDLSFLLFPDRFLTAKQRYLAAFTRATAARARHIIAVSESTRADILRLLHVPPERVSVVYEGVEERFHPPLPEDVAAFRRRAELPEHFLLHVGTLEPRKNLAVLIRAFAALRERGVIDGVHDWPLVLAGGKGWMYESIYDLVHELGLDECVRFVGYVADDELPLWYGASGIVVVPSTYEGFGLPLLEAMACGAPVIASNASSLPEVVGDAGIVVDCTSERYLIDQCEHLISNAAERSTLGMRARQRALQFTWERAARDTLAIYRRVLQA